MYAVIEEGGKQYRVREGDLVYVDLRAGLEPGAEVTLDRVLLSGGPSGVRVGRPLIEGARVGAVVEASPVKGNKIQGMKRRLVSSSKTKKGHRQQYTLLRIGSIRIPAE